MTNDLTDYLSHCTADGICVNCKYDELANELVVDMHRRGSKVHYEDRISYTQPVMENGMFCDSASDLVLDSMNKLHKQMIETEAKKIMEAEK